MTPLRDQLRQARSSYADARYPGDLAAELIPPARRVSRAWFGLSSLAAVGVAAAAAVLIAVRPGGPAPVAPSPGPSPRPAAAAADRVNARPMLASLPDRVSLSLPAGPLFPATVPVRVSLSSLQADLSRLDPSADLAPWLRQQLQGPVRPAQAPAPAVPALPVPATQQAV